MTIVYSERFKQDIANAFAFGEEQFGRATAERSYRRIIDHIEHFLAAYPRTGRWRSDIRCYHAWIPRTPFVVFYRIDDEQLEVLALFHGAQDIADFRR